MNNLNFRIWDKTRNILCCGINNFEFGFLDNKQVIKYVILPAEPESIFLNSREFEIMQFTGLKDKNNKKIYEGDILLRAAAGYKYIVFWSTPDAAWMLKDQDGDCSIYLSDFNPKNLEIIGNIYEN